MHLLQWVVGVCLASLRDLPVEILLDIIGDETAHLNIEQQMREHSKETKVKMKEHRRRDTWDDFVGRYSSELDMTIIEQMLDGEAYLQRRKHFEAKTKGLLHGELHRAQLYGICSELIDVVADKELGYNLESAVPFAYFAHLHGCLTSVVSFQGMDPFFFFTTTDFHPILDEVYFPWDSTAHSNPFWLEHKQDGDNGRNEQNLPRSLHFPSYGLTWPPFKEFYANDFFKGIGKPIAIIGAKHTTEWGGPPINTFSEPSKLKPIIDILLDFGYLVLYRRPKDTIGNDSTQLTVDPGEYEFIESEYAEQDVIIWDQMVPKLLQLGTIEPAISRMNVLTLALYNNADLFVATQGGNSALCSLFDAEVFVFHVAGSECIEQNSPPRTDQYVYPRWSQHGGGRFTVYNYHDDLVRNLEAYLLQRKYAEESFKLHPIA